MQKRISNIESLRYQKLLLRSKIQLKEERMRQYVREMDYSIRHLNVKNELLQLLLNNPALIINTARITYELISKIKSWRRSANR